MSYLIAANEIAETALRFYKLWHGEKGESDSEIAEKLSTLTLLHAAARKSTLDYSQLGAVGTLFSRCDAEGRELNATDLEPLKTNADHALAEAQAAGQRINDAISGANKSE